MARIMRRPRSKDLARRSLPFRWNVKLASKRVVGNGQLPLEWLGSELASFEVLLATRRGKEGGGKK